MSLESEPAGSPLDEVVAAVCNELIEHADELNRLDGAAGDGDLGVTARAIAHALLGDRTLLHDPDPGRVLTAAGVLVAERAPSTAGTLIASALLGAGRAAAGASPDPGQRFAHLLRSAYEAVETRGKAQRGARTMLDALGPASDAAVAAAAGGSPLLEVMRSAADAAIAGARETAAMAARFGRAGWVPERAAGQVDAGAWLVAILLDSAASAVARLSR